MKPGNDLTVAGLCLSARYRSFAVVSRLDLPASRSFHYPPPRRLIGLLVARKKRVGVSPAPGCFHINQREDLPLGTPLPSERMPGASFQVLQPGFLFRHEDSSAIAADGALAQQRASVRPDDACVGQIHGRQRRGGLPVVRVCMRAWSWHGGWASWQPPKY